MIVYTAVSGAYPITRTDVRCFTGDGIFQRPVMEAKRYKVLPHLFLDAAATVWVDANVWLRDEATAAELLGDADVALVAHPYRATVWEEFATLHEQRRFKIAWLQAQLTEQEAAYRAAGLPDDARLFECNFLIRCNIERVNRLMEAWWSQICRWQWRDQVSLPFVLWKYGEGVKVNVLEISVRDDPRFGYESQY